MSQLSRETPEQSKPTYLAGGRIPLTPHQLDNLTYPVIQTSIPRYFIFYENNIS